MLDEGLLQRMQGAVAAQPFDGGDAAALVLDRERQELMRSPSTSTVQAPQAP